MSIFSYSHNAAMPAPCVGGVVTIGNFDGVHLGHQALLAETGRQAQALAIPSVAVTFDPPPSRLLRPELAGPLLLTLDDRAALLQQHGVDHVLILQTSLALLQLGAREFFEKILRDQLRVRSLVEGFNFGFGKNREGTIDVLKGLCAEQNVALTLLPPREVLDAPVSSSRVRTELLAGRVEVVAALLGREYRISGIVGTGQKRGATLGFPTANLSAIATLIPGNGVYAVRATTDGKTWPAVANIGPNPTFGENSRKVEAHLIGFGGDLYGKYLSVEFVKKIRETKKFGSVHELAVQIGEDVRNARTVLGAFV